MSEMQASPQQCPGCGVYYAKVTQHRAVDPNSEPSRPKGKFASAWLGARVSVEEGRRRRAEQQSAMELRRSAEHANGVVVVDIKMSFWSMVVFMVKWAIAAIPAILILFVLGSIAWGIVLGLTAGFSSPPKL